MIARESREQVRGACSSKYEQISAPDVHENPFLEDGLLLIVLETSDGPKARKPERRPVLAASLGRASVRVATPRRRRRRRRPFRELRATRRRSGLRPRTRDTLTRLVMDPRPMVSIC